MCRYAFAGPYKRHYACFTCRKAFKQPSIEDYLDSRGRGYVYKQLRQVLSNQKSLHLCEQELGHRLSDLEDEYRNATRKCPECSGEMVDMGLDFKPPVQNDVKAWKTLQGMYRIGHAFHTCGCNGPGWIPQSTSDYRSYLSSTKKQYEEQLAFVQRSNSLSLGGTKEAVDYWISRIEAIESEQKNVG